MQKFAECAFSANAFLAIDVLLHIYLFIYECFFYFTFLQIVKSFNHIHIAL